MSSIFVPNITVSLRKVKACDRCSALSCEVNFCVECVRVHYEGGSSGRAPEIDELLSNSILSRSTTKFPAPAHDDIKEYLK